MSEVVSTFVMCDNETHFFSSDHKKELNEFLKTRAKEITGIQVTSFMTVEEYEKYVRND